MPRLIVTWVLVAFAGCSQSSSTPDANWPRLDHGVDQAADQAADVAQDQAVGDQTLDCPVVDLGSGVGWRVAHVAKAALRAAACVDGHLFAAGDKGTLLHRAPQSGLCSGFVKQSVPTTSDLLTVAFADATYGVTAGRDPQIWETKDLGDSWAIAPQCGTVKFAAFHDLNLYSTLKGFGAGEVTSTSGAYKIFAGKTWICPDQTFTNQVFYGTFRQGDSAWLVGDTKGLMYYTPDEAVTWFTTTADTEKALRAVTFTSGGIGVAVGDEGVILRTEDGMAWDRVMTLGTDDLYGVFFWDDKLGWAVGEAGTIMQSQDGGKSWSYQSAPTSERLEGVCFTSATEGWIVGEGGSILATTSGGS